MGKRTRLEIYDDFPTDGISEAIDLWVHNARDRAILRYILVDGYSYRKTADLMAHDTGIIYNEKTMQRALNRAENVLYPHLKVTYKHDK